ncbi:MAG: septum formation protein Maf [Anaplasmataceae bacterium]|nr:septum formation protein Maf [Anaplasmataceae bacterium]
MTKKILLGSQSPRRKEILNFFNLPFLQVASHFDEESIPFTGDPIVYSTQLAECKATALSSRFPNEIILTADTVVFLNNKVYNKPANAKEAAQFLRELGGHWHTVHTAVHVRHGDTSFSDSETTKLLFYRLSEEQIEQFHRHLYCFDKAGGYAIEGCGQLILEKMEGCYYNVLGLPINATRRLLKKVGIDLWHHLRNIP